MALHKNIIYYSGYCLIILAALSSGVCFGSSPSFKQTVHYHYFLSPEGSEYPIYLHIESPDGPDPLTMKSGLFDQDMADEMPLRPAGEAEALPTQPGQSGYTIWLIERQKRELNAQDQSFGIPVFARQGGKPCLLMNGDSICGGGQDDIDHKNRKPPMGMGGEFPSGEDLDYEVYSGLAWLNHFASTLMSWQQETVENDDVIIRIIDPDNRQIRLRHINQEDWQSMTRAMHPGISDEDLEKLVRWSQRATVTIQVKNREVLSGAHNAGSGRIPGMISFGDNDGAAPEPVFSSSPSQAGGARGGSPYLTTSFSGGMRSGGSGGDEGGGDGEQAQYKCPMCSLFFTQAELVDHYGVHLREQIQAHTQAMPSASTHLTMSPSGPSGSRAAPLTKEQKRRRLAEARYKTRPVSVAASTTMVEAQVRESIESQGTARAFKEAVSHLGTLSSQQWQVFSVVLGQYLGGNGLLSHREYLEVAANLPEQALFEMQLRLTGHPGQQIDENQANKLMLTAMTKAAQEVPGLEVVAKAVQSKARLYQVTMNKVGADFKTLLNYCNTLMKNGFLESTRLADLTLGQSLVDLLLDLAADMEKEADMVNAVALIDSGELTRENLDRVGNLRDLARYYEELCRQVLSKTDDEINANLLYNMMSRSGAWEQEPQLLPALSGALQHVWKSSDPELQENLAYLALYLLQDNFLVETPAPVAMAYQPPAAATYMPVAVPAVAILEKKPTIDQLRSEGIISELSSVDAVNLLFYLGVPLNKLDDLRAEHKSGLQVNVHGFQMWLDQDLKATWKKLIAKLDAIGKYSLADRLKASLLNRISLDTLLEPSHLGQILNETVEVKHLAALFLQALGVPESEITSFEMQYRDQQRVLMKGLSYWLNHDEQATMRKLIRALQSPSVNQPRVAWKIQQQYGGL